MNRWYVAFALAVALVGAFAVRPAAAAEVDKTLVAFGTQWHDGSETGTTAPTFTVAPGDSLHLRIENHDAYNHTFTLPYWSVDVAFGPGSPSNPVVHYFNVTTSSANLGKWQFYCNIPGHSLGTYPDRTGMVGWIQVANATSPPPKTPGFEAFAAIGAIAAAFLVVAVWRRRP